MTTITGVKDSALTAATSINQSDTVAIVQSGTSKKATIAELFDLVQIAAPSTAPTATINAVAGNLTGQYTYSVTFVTAIGETQIGPTSDLLSVTAQRVNLTAIPTGPTGTTARKIYRTNTTETGYWPKLLATISDNTTTTYADNIANGSLGALNLRINKTGGAISVNGEPRFVADPGVTIIGANTGLTNGGYENTYIGEGVAPAGTESYWNTCVGSRAGNGLTTGFENAFFGRYAGNKITTGKYDTYLGVSAGANDTTANDNVKIGYCSGLAGTIEGQHVYVGVYSMIYQTTGDTNIAIGHTAGQKTAAGANLTSISHSILIGWDTRALANDDDNEIVIGHAAVGLGSNSTVIGNSSTTICRLWGTARIGGTLQSAIHEVAYLQPGSDSTSRGRGTALAIYAQPTDSDALYHAGVIYGRFDSSTFDTERITIQSSVGGTLTDTLTLKSGKVGIGENSPDYKLDVNGTFGFTPGASVTPVDNGDVVFQLTSNTQLTIKAKGSDGTVRSANITLA